jgi:hypothetical protein
MASLKRTTKSTRQPLTPTITALALQLADEHAACAIGSVAVPAGEWLNLSRALQGPRSDIEGPHTATCMHYLECRGKLTRHPRNLYMVSLA